MKRETIIQILRIYTTSPESTREKIADAILEHQKIDMPTEEEIIDNLRRLWGEAEDAPLYYEKSVAKWIRDEIERRNK